jgi:hypothetical protein
VDLLILDDFALHPLDVLDTADVYDLIVERHRALSTVMTSTVSPPNGWARCPTLCSPSPPLTASSPPPTSSCPMASQTSAVSSPNSTSEPSPLGPVVGATPDPSVPGRDHHHADAQEPDKWPYATGERVAPSSWRATAGVSTNRRCSRTRAPEHEQCKGDPS